MEPIRSIRLRQLHGQLGEIAFQLTQVQFSHFGPPKHWQPALNAYRCADCMTICVDLAGVDRSLIDLQVEPQRVLIRGRRHAPEPTAAETKTMQILALE